MIPVLPISKEQQQKILRGLMIAGGLYLGYRVTRKAIKNMRSRNTSVLADQSPEVRQAMGLRSAMNPSGVSWLMWSDGTNEDAIAQIASQITNLDAVATAYRNLYGKELIQDLQGELSTDKFNAFLQTISNNRINNSSGSSSSSRSSSGAYTAPQRMIVAKRSVFVRTSPDASYHGAWYEVGENKNIYKTASPGEFIGYATGKQHFDSKNNVKFIEVAFRVGAVAPGSLASKVGQSMLLWISASSNYIAQFTSESALAQAYPNARNQLSYMLPIPGLGWLSAPGSRVITNEAAMVLGEKFQPIASVLEDVLLGYPVMSLDGNAMNYTLVRTLEGNDRWINSNQIRTE
tara:strand:- start:30900 stop:31940 length:1041 start_codon:yes stop_codon:yes gene_type:complete